MKGQYWFKQDEDNILNYLQGSDRNYKPVYESFDKLIMRVLGKFILDTVNREELIGDIHLHLYNKIEKFNIEKSTTKTPVFNYFTQLIFREVYKYMLVRKKTLHFSSFDSKIQYEDQGESEEKELIEERLHDISKIVKGFDDHWKVLFDLYFIQELDMKNIAVKLEVTPNFVFQQLRDLRIEIRNQLGLTGKLPKINQRRRSS